MSSVIKTFDFLSDDERRGCIERIISYFAEERDEVIGHIAAEQILDFFLALTATHAYNRGVDDARAFVKTRTADIDIELDLLRKNS